MASNKRAVFPLKTVLYPGAEMELIIFEPRYLDMVSYCLQHQLPFIVCCATSGSEIETQQIFEPIGCFAHIIDFDQREDGVLIIKVRGGSRVCVLEHEMTADNLRLTNDYRVLPEIEDILLPEEASPLRELLLKLASLPDIALSVNKLDLDSALYVVYQLAQLLPLELEFKQYLLEESDSFEKCMELYEQLLFDSLHEEDNQK